MISKCYLKKISKIVLISLENTSRKKKSAFLNPLIIMIFKS